MQTFVPYGADFKSNAQCLDRQRLGKQRVETWQILNAMRNTTGWANHPAVRMWRGNEPALAWYGHAMCREWIYRGYKDTMLPRFLDLIDQFSKDQHPNLNSRPGWLADRNVIISHRSNLIRKMPEHYGPFWPDVPNDLPYVWPDAS